MSADDELLLDDDDRLELKIKALGSEALVPPPAPADSSRHSSPDTEDIDAGEADRCVVGGGGGRFKQVAATTESCDEDGDKSELKLVSRLFVPL